MTYMICKLPCRRILWIRCVAVLILFLVSLQLIHVALLSRLTAPNSWSHTSSASQHTNNSHIMQAMMAAIQSTLVLDTTGEYILVRDVYHHKLYIPSTRSDHKTNNNNKIHDSQSSLDRSDDVTLVSQCSVSNLHHLYDFIHHWDGPISVSVFVPLNDTFIAMQYLQYLHTCVSDRLNSVSVHFVFPIQHGPQFTGVNFDASYKSYDCTALSSMQMEKLTKDSNYAMKNFKYPNNLLRNTAIRFSSSAYVFVIDMDMLPNHNLRTRFREFIKIFPPISKSGGNPGESQTAYVVPAFEIKEDLAIPRDIAGLLQMWSEGLLQPFYNDLCEKCHRPTNYTLWRSYHSNIQRGGDISVGYEVGWVDPWEPFFIAPSYMPLYDERFKQYGFNRISQVCEMHVSGYTFAALTNAFLIHKGFKVASSFHKHKEEEQNSNRMLFREFKTGLKRKYPKSTRRC